MLGMAECIYKKRMKGYSTFWNEIIDNLNEGHEGDCIHESDKRLYKQSQEQVKYNVGCQYLVK